MTGGAGLAVAAASGAFLLLNRAQQSDRESAFQLQLSKHQSGGSCDPALGKQDAYCRRSLELALDDLEAVRGRAVFGDVGLGVGGAALAGGVVLLFTGDPIHRYDPSPQSDVFGNLRLQPWLSAELGGASVSASF